MSNFCNYCRLSSPICGCTKLDNEDCLNEIFDKMIKYICKQNPTNGYLFRVLFPDAQVTAIMDEQYELKSIKLSADWWNAQYKKGE